jgi:hypothetical protein
MNVLCFLQVVRFVAALWAKVEMGQGLTKEKPIDLVVKVRLSPERLPLGQ